MKAALRYATGELPPGGVPKPRLLEEVRRAIRSRHFSRRTEEAYVSWIKRYILFHGKRHPTEMAEPEISRFLSSLATEARVSASTQNQALSALLFLYREVLRTDIDWLDGVVRARAARRLPVVLTKEEVKAVLGQLDGTRWLMATLLYGAGLRLMECLRLRVKDVDFVSSQLLVRGGKGNKDRRTMLPAAVKDPLARHLEQVKKEYLRDRERGIGPVTLPDALERKYSNAGREWPWYYVFPASVPFVDPLTGRRRRHHVHESVLQKAVKEAVRRAGITKPATCHTFRHSFATHLLQGVAFLPCHPEGTEAPTAWIS